MARLYGNQHSALGSLGLLAIRVTVGAALIFHGWGKINGPNGMTAWMSGMPKPLSDTPPALQAAAALSEFGGGILFVLGFLTPLAALAVAGTMIGALYMVHVPSGHPYVDPAGGPSCELASVYLAVAVGLLFLGAGMFSVDGLLFRRRPVAPADRVAY